MVYNELGLVITDRCNAECSFCAFGCSPAGAKVMPPELAKRMIDEAGALHFEMLGITGGESFLYPELMFEILEYAKQAGFKERHVATNGFWGSWEDEKLAETAKRLKDCVDHVSFSFDSFHAEYIPVRSVWRAADALKKQGVAYKIHVADVYGERGAGPFLASLGPESMYRGYRVYPLGRYGRAANMPDELFVKFCPWNETDCRPGGAIAVDPDGKVYPCCNPAVVETCLSLGNVMNTSLSELLSNNNKNMRYINAMRNPELFRRLLAYVRDESGGDIPEKVCEGCDLCNIIFKNPELSKKSLQYLDSICFEKFKESLIGRQGGGE